MRTEILLLLALVAFACASKQAFILQTTPGNCITYHAPAPGSLLVAPVSPLDRSQHWYFHSATWWGFGNGSIISSRLYEDAGVQVVFDVENEIKKPNTTVLAYELKWSDQFVDPADVANERFTYDNETQLLYSELDTSFVVVPTADGRVVIVKAANYTGTSFSLVPALPEYEVTIVNQAGPDVKVTFTNAPASELTTSWWINRHTSFQRLHFVQGSQLSFKDPLGRALSIASTTITKDTVIVIDYQTPNIVQPLFQDPDN